MRWLYLHGFASGPTSTKAGVFTEHFAKRGVALERLDLRQPSFEHLRLSAMIEHACARIDDGGAIVIGSSLGGLTAARVAERDPRVVAVVLLAPAFQIAERWRAQLGEGWESWRRTGWREVQDHVTGTTARVDFGFVEDCAVTDVGWPDVRVPTLICHGRNDEAVPIESSRRFAVGRANVRLVELDDGHELKASLPTLLAESEQHLARWLQ